MHFDTPIRNIHLHGALGEQFGAQHALAVRSPADAVRALCALYPEFGIELRRQAAANIEWAVLVDDEEITAEELRLQRGAKAAFHFLPKAAGAKSKYAGIAIGVLLAVVTYGAASGYLGAAAASAFASGGSLYAGAMGLATSMVLGGVAQMFAPHPNTNSLSDSQTGSYGFGGPVSLYGEGYRIPLVFGRMLVPGIGVVTGQRIKDISHDGIVASEAWLHVVEIVGAGPVVGLAHGDPAQDVYLAEVPLGRFENPPSFAFMRGTADQPVLVHDNDAGSSVLEEEFADGREIRQSGSPYVLQISDGDADFVRLQFQVPALGYQNDAGGLDARSIELAFEGNTGNGWTPLSLTDASRSLHQTDWVMANPETLDSSTYQLQLGGAAAAATRYACTIPFPTLPADGAHFSHTVASAVLILRQGVSVQIDGVWSDVTWGESRGFDAAAIWATSYMGSAGGGAGGAVGGGFGGETGGIGGGVGDGSNGGSGRQIKTANTLNLDNAEIAALNPAAFTLPTRVVLQIQRAEYVLSTVGPGTNTQEILPLAPVIAAAVCAVRANLEIYDAISGAYSFTVSLARPAGSGTWSLRINRLTPDSTSTRLQTTLYLVSYTTVYNERMNWPYIAYASYWIRAKDFPSLPDRAIDLYGMEVPIPANYDGYTHSYATTGDGTSNGTWNGTFKTGWTNNPLWLWWFLFTSQLDGVGDFVDPDELNVWQLYRIGQFCDERVPDGLGGTEPRFTCNLRIAEEMNAWEAQTQLAAIFRGMVYAGASGIQVNQDRPDKLPVAAFNPTNVLDGMFDYPGSDLDTRSTVYNVTWQDPDNFYKAAIERYEGRDPFTGRNLIEEYGFVREMPVAALGITSRAMALRVAKWFNYTEWGQTGATSYGVGKDGAIVRPGDWVEISDPLKAGQSRGRRLLSTQGNSVTLNAPLSYSAGMQLVWYDMGVNPPTRRVYPVQTFEGEAVALTLVHTEPYLPALEAPVIAESDDLQLPVFEILTVTEQDDGSCVVTALRTWAGKYDLVEEDILLSVPRTSNLPDLKTLPPTPTELTLRDELYTDAGQSTVSRLIASWQGGAAGVRGYIVAWRVSGSSYWDEQPETRNNSQTLQPVEAGALYDVRVWAINLVGVRSQPAELLAYQPTATGPQLDAPALVLDAPFNSTGLRVHWGAVATAVNYEIAIENFAGDTVHTRQIGPVTQYGYALDAMRADSGPWRWLRVKVRALNAFGQTGPWGQLDATNPQAAAPTLQLTAAGMAINAQFTAGDDDTSGYMLWLSTDPVFDIGINNLVYDGNSANASITALSGGPLVLGHIYYGRAAAYDAIDRDNLNYSGVVQVITSSITDIIAGLGGIGPGALTPDLIEKMNGLEGLDIATVVSAADQVADAVRDQAQLTESVAYALLAQEQGWEQRRKLGSSVAGIRRDVTVVADGLTAAVTEQETLAARVGDNEAALVTERQVRVDQNQSLSTQLTVLDTDYQGNKAGVAQQLTAVSAAASAQAQTITALQGSVGGNSASINAILGLTISPTSALASAITALQASASGNSASINNILSLNISAGSALATSLNNLSTSVSGNTSTISTLKSSVNGLGSKYAVTIVDTGANGKKVSGFELASGGSGSAFDVFANIFRVSQPDGSGSKQVFVIGTLGDGSAGVGISGSLFVDGTIGARSLAVTQLSAISANIGTITAGTLWSSSGTSYLSLGASGTQWFLNCNNGVAFIRADGYAEFSNVKVRGDVQANTLNGQIVDTGNVNYGAITAAATVSLPTGGASGTASITVNIPAGSFVLLLCSGNFSATAGGFPLSGATYARSGWSKASGTHTTDPSPPTGTVTYQVSFSTAAAGAALQNGDFTVQILKR